MSPGEWIFRGADQHECAPPDWRSTSVKIGDVWKCDCGQAWIVGYEQRDGKYLRRATDAEVNRAMQLAEEARRHAG